MRMRTRLKRRVHNGPSRRVSGLLDRHDLGVPSGDRFSTSFAHYLTVPDDNGAYRGTRRHLAQPLATQFDRPFHVAPVAGIARRHG